MTPESRAKEAVYAWIHGHAPLAVKMKLTPQNATPLINAITEAIAAAERAAYERAAELVRLESHSLYLEILALIDKPKEPT